MQDIILEARTVADARAIARKAIDMFVSFDVSVSNARSTWEFRFRTGVAHRHIERFMRQRHERRIRREDRSANGD